MIVKLENKINFPQEFLQVSSKTRLQEYNDVSCGIFRCPYIASEWDRLSRITYEYPIVWYKLPGKDKDLNESICQIRFSILDLETLDLDKLSKLPEITKHLKKCYAVDTYGRGYEISEEAEDIFMEFPDVYLEEDTGLLYLVPQNKNSIFSTRNGVKIKEVYSSENGFKSKADEELLCKLL